MSKSWAEVGADTTQFGPIDIASAIEKKDSVGAQIAARMLFEELEKPESKARSNSINGMLKEFSARQVAVEQVLLDRAEIAVEAFPDAGIEKESEDLFGDNGEDEEDGEEEEDQEE